MVHNSECSTAVFFSDLLTTMAAHLESGQEMTCRLSVTWPMCQPALDLANQEHA